MYLSRSNNLKFVTVLKPAISISTKTELAIEKQNKFRSSSFSRTSIYFSFEESINYKVIINGKLLWTIIGGIRFISKAPWIWDLVFLIKVNLLFPFVRNELAFILSLSFKVWIGIKADQFWYLVLKSVICDFK